MSLLDESFNSFIEYRLLLPLKRMQMSLAEFNLLQMVLPGIKTRFPFVVINGGRSSRNLAEISRLLAPTLIISIPSSLPDNPIPDHSL